ncbi:hypothetical protein Lal_00033247 [Lupinus albus]|nr:hypothetical protein Lal_00033247 [Lupinus albus]
METQSDQLKRIDELHASYFLSNIRCSFHLEMMGLDMIVRADSHNRKKNCVTIREWMSFKLKTRKNETQTLFSSRRLFHKFLVDAYTIVESERFSFIKRNQTKLRADKS